MENDDSMSKKGEDEKKGKTLLVIMMGAPGSGKSTFCDHVMSASSRPWVRICQDNINNGKSGTKVQCLSSAAVALKENKSVFIDRCNLDREQRAEFVKLGSSDVGVHVVVLDLPAKLCISRSVKRTGHEGNLQGGKAAAVVNRMLQKKELPKLSEGFSRITICQTEHDVQEAVTTYSLLGPSDTLPSGCYGLKSPDTKKQVGIMKFLKKVDPPTNVVSSSSNTLSSSSCQSIKEKQTCNEVPIPDLSGRAKDEQTKGEHIKFESACDTSALTAAPTLAFPSISTDGFQFDIEKASDIIVEKVEEYIKKLGNARLVMIDLTHHSRILSLVKAKVAERNIDPNKFFTFVGDITCLYSKGGLRCNVIANAANWRLRPGGGGVNAAIFNAAGPSLEIATKERAKSLSPGKAVVVPLPSISPLFKREAVTHVIHVLGPNMNPERPNCLNNNYDEGCKILREAYSSLFEGFRTILKSQTIATERGSGKTHLKQSDNTSSDQKIKDEDGCSNERSKKHKGLKYEIDCDLADVRKEMQQLDKVKKNTSTSKAWASWALALYNIAMNPQKHEKDVLETTADVVVINDAYPKAEKHILVIARANGLDGIRDVCKEHLVLLQMMHKVGMGWVERFLQEDESLIFRLGFHSVPSMRQLHLHVISQDFDSESLKNKKHWNSFNTEFFRDAVDVIEEIEKFGTPSLGDESLLLKELRCHRCKSAHPNIPRLKSHISQCRASFPTELLRKGRLIQASPKTNSIP
ncbi:transcription factor bHLH140-like [Silene latifolia]|uniref:transcription factor bHLH140-like n=1 Tax=Silene latifolia TaxID=37657 RepID=UPI003D77F878